MSLSFLSPIAGFAAGALGAKTLKSAFDGGKSFLQSLAKTDSDQPTVPTTEELTALESLRQKLRSQLDQFQQTLLRRFQTAGVDTSQPISLTADSFGDVVETSSHPDRDIIDKLFQDDPVLAAKFRELSSDAARLQQTLGHPSENAKRPAAPRLVLAGGEIAVDFSADE